MEVSQALFRLGNSCARKHYRNLRDDRLDPLLHSETSRNGRNVVPVLWLPRGPAALRAILHLRSVLDPTMGILGLGMEIS